MLLKQGPLMTESNFTSNHNAVPPICFDPVLE